MIGRCPELIFQMEGWVEGEGQWPAQSTKDFGNFGNSKTLWWCHHETYIRKRGKTRHRCDLTYCIKRKNMKNCSLCCCVTRSHTHIHTPCVPSSSKRSPHPFFELYVCVLLLLVQYAIISPLLFLTLIRLSLFFVSLSFSSSFLQSTTLLILHNHYNIFHCMLCV